MIRKLFNFFKRLKYDVILVWGAMLVFVFLIWGKIVYWIISKWV